MIKMIRDATTIARRNMIRIGRVPEVMVFVIVQPLMFVLLLLTCLAVQLTFPEVTIASSSSPASLLKRWFLVLHSPRRGWPKTCKRSHQQIQITTNVTFRSCCRTHS